MKKIIFMVEYRVANKEQTIDRDVYKEFDSLIEAKNFIIKGLDEWDETGKGICNAQIIEEERMYNNVINKNDYDLIRKRVYSPLINNKWYRDEWTTER